MPAVAQRAGQNGSREESLLPKIPVKGVSNTVRLEAYLRTAKNLLRQADLYRVSRDDRQVYTFLMRFASLLVETIPHHKDYVESRPPPEYVALRKVLVTRYMAELEAVKLALQLKGEETSRAFVHQQGLNPNTQQLTTSALPQLDWDTLTGTSRPAPSAPPLPPQGLPDPWDLAASAPGLPQQGAASLALPTFDTSGWGPTSSDARERHMLLPAATGRLRPRSSPLPPSASVYPQVIRPETVQQGSLMDADHRPPGGVPDLMPSPSMELQLGPQALEVQQHSASQADPGAVCCAPAPKPPDAQVSDTAGGVSKQRLEIREVHISANLMEDFLRYAKANTSRSIESCGILAGTLDLEQDTFSINTLIVPKQEGTSDTVAALGEEEIFEAQDSRGLFPMGWIHTHPSQTCFLSSIDIHTQCGYQTMLDEAVAIVMAPRDSKRRCGIFRLSTPGGLKLVQRCPSRGFHTHPTPDTGQPIYEVCGHVYLNPGLKHEVLDLR